MRKRRCLLLFVGATLACFAVPCARAQERLVWQADFSGTHGRQPDPSVWGYDEGDNGWLNQELEMYCAYGSNKAPCDAKEPNAFVADGMLHIVARRTPDGRYTSARLVSRGKKEFQYGRVEVSLRVPVGKGMWPAFWFLGTNGKPWPDCGEMDLMENIGSDAATVFGSVHGTGFINKNLTTAHRLPDGMKATDAFHTYGMLWRPESVSFYVDDPAKPYATYTPKDLPAGAVWPFAEGPYSMLINLAVGGSWPGSPDGSTKFPQEYLVRSIKVWQDSVATAKKGEHGSRL